jgi:hypothetical protein
MVPNQKNSPRFGKPQPIIIVTIQTFPFVLRAIENSVSLKENATTRSSPTKRILHKQVRPLASLKKC